MGSVLVYKVQPLFLEPPVTSGRERRAGQFRDKQRKLCIRRYFDPPLPLSQCDLLKQNRNICFCTVVKSVSGPGTLKLQTCFSGYLILLWLTAAYFLFLSLKLTFTYVLCDFNGLRRSA